MSCLYAILSGIIQGLTEFLPVSSSAHLCLIGRLFGVDLGGHFTFSILLHLATLAAVFIVCREDIALLFRSGITLLKRPFGKTADARLSVGERVLVNLFIATLPLICAVFLSERVEVLMSHTRLIGGILIINALMLALSDRIGKNNVVGLDGIKAKNALVIGFIQLIATVPGLSRSGSTVFGGLTQGLDRRTAVRFSFLLSIPAILGANLTELVRLVSSPVPASDILPMALGMAAALISGIMAMKLIECISQRTLLPFSVYCAVVGTAAVIFG